MHQLRMGDRIICDIERDDLHREIVRTQGRLSTGFGYDAMNRRSWQSSMCPERSGNELAGFSPNKGQLWRSYGYNAADELFERHDALRGVTQYRYDMDGRLLGCLTKTGAEHFHWDDADNPCDTSASRSAGAVSNNRLMVWQDLRFSYDAFGNVRSRKKGAWQQQHFTYDADDRLIEVHGDTRQGELITRFTYDALGRRIGKTVRTAQDWAPDQRRSETKFVWQGLRLLQEITNDRISTYVYEQDGTANYAPLARIDQPVRSDGSPGQGQIYYFHTDQIGTPLEVTDEDGRLVWAGEYGAWGWVTRQVLDAPLKMGEEFAQPLRFAGQYEDDSTGLHYNTFRYYDPEVGRFLTRDPIGLAGGINLYQYASNSTGWIDPWGLSRIPFGFNSFGEFRQFGQTLQAGLARMGFPGAASYMQGSAVTGVSFETKIPFDVGRVSDFDVAISQSDLYKHAETLGIGKGGRTEPIKMDSDLAKKIGINDLLLKLSRKAGGREVNAMIFESADSIKSKGASTRIPGKC